MADQASKTAAAATPSAKSKLSRRNRRKVGRDKRRAKLQTDKEFAKAYFAARSKRSTDKKAAFRKKKKNKK
jgi:hypothetical protein